MLCLLEQGLCGYKRYSWVELIVFHLVSICLAGADWCVNGPGKVPRSVFSTAETSRVAARQGLGPQ
jgi:hypothetical protein